MLLELPTLAVLSTLFCGLELPPLAVLCHFKKLLTLALLMALLGPGSGLVKELLTLAVLMAHVGHYIAKFDGVSSELPPVGSSYGTL